MPETDPVKIREALLGYARAEIKNGRPVPESVFTALDKLGIEDPASRQKLSRELIQTFAKRGGKKSAEKRGRPKPRPKPVFSPETREAMIRDARIHALRFGPPEEKDRE